MVRLGLKLYYLRTQVRGLSQQDLADQLGVRQATLSHVERGSALPSIPLLVELCRFFDVTPTYFLDEDRGLQPRPTERWSLRDGLVTTGMWLEVEASETRKLSDGKLLCPLLPNGAFYDDEAREKREEADSSKQLAALARARKREESKLVKSLQTELEKHPRARRKPS